MNCGSSAQPTISSCCPRHRFSHDAFNIIFLWQLFLMVSKIAAKLVTLWNQLCCRVARLSQQSLPPLLVDACCLDHHQKQRFSLCLNIVGFSEIASFVTCFLRHLISYLRPRHRNKCFFVCRWLMIRCSAIAFSGRKRDLGSKFNEAI